MTILCELVVSFKAGLYVLFHYSDLNLFRAHLLPRMYLCSPRVAVSCSSFLTLGDLQTAFAVVLQKLCTEGLAFPLSLAYIPCAPWASPSIPHLSESEENLLTCALILYL